MRLFVGIPIPEGLGRRIAILNGGIPGAAWIPPESMHLTLRFIGEVQPGIAADIDDALISVQAPSFDLHLQGVGTFGQGARARTLWVGFVASAPLDFLQAKIESAVVRAGQPPEGRKFSPHVTLARLKNADPRRLKNFIEGNNLFRAGPWTVETFTLFESTQGKGGAVYTPLSDYPLRT